MNEVNLIGRLGKDPRVSYLPSQVAVASLTIATDETYTNKEGKKTPRTEWHRVSVYGKRAEFCLNNLTTGRLVRVRGVLRTRSWTDANGTKRFITEIVVMGPESKIEALDARRDKRQSPPASNHSQSPNNTPSAQQRRTRHTPPPIPPDEELGPAFPSECSDMDEVPF